MSGVLNGGAEREVVGTPTAPADAIKRGGKTALMDAKAEQALRDVGAPVRCCDYWPECSHILSWIEKQEAESGR